MGQGRRAGMPPSLPDGCVTAVRSPAFIVYQLYRFSYTHGWALIVLSVFDIVVVWLIWHEYRVVRHFDPLKGRP